MGSGKAATTKNGDGSLNTKPALGISIVNYLSLEDVKVLLRDIIRLDDYLDLHVIVVDNSAYESGAEAEALRVICASTAFKCEYIPSANRGCAAGNNIAFENLIDSEVDAIWVLNPDCRLDGSGAKALAEGLTASRGRAQVLATALRDPVSGQMRPGVSYIQLPTTRTIRVTTTRAVKTSSWRQAFAEGYSFLVTRQALNVLEKFDDDLFLFYEEAEFMTRGARLGIGLAVLHGVVVRHAQGGVTGSGAFPAGRSRSTLYHANRSCVLFYRKHHVWLLASCLLARGAQALRLLLEAQPALSLAVMRGIWAGISCRRSQNLPMPYDTTAGVLHHSV